MMFSYILSRAREAGSPLKAANHRTEEHPGPSAVGEVSYTLPQPLTREVKITKAGWAWHVTI